MNRLPKNQLIAMLCNEYGIDIECTIDEDDTVTIHNIDNELESVNEQLTNLWLFNRIRELSSCSGINTGSTSPSDTIYHDGDIGFLPQQITITATSEINGAEFVVHDTDLNYALTMMAYLLIRNKKCLEFDRSIIKET